MAKKSKIANYKQKAPKMEQVHKVFDGGNWDPLESHDRRDQRYLKTIKPRSEGQKRLMQAIKEQNLTLALGPAGTGKTYLAISAAVEAFEKGEVDRIILSRPAIEAGESIGFLPGDLQDKMAPFLRPLYDALNDRLGLKKLKMLIDSGETREA
jgi:phosphate starvation-inducible PhoH-like protein